MPAGTSPGAAVSPEGLPCGFGIGALMEERSVQSREREMAMVLSSAALKSFDLDGKWSFVTALSWWTRFPSERLRGFSDVLLAIRDGGTVGGFEVCDLDGAVVEMLYRFTRSSELPVARMRFPLSVAGERAIHRIEEVWAAKRNVSENEMLCAPVCLWSVPLTSSEAVVEWRHDLGRVAVTPWRTRS